MTDVSPIIPAGRQVVESYGGGGFRISGERFEHAVIIRPTVTEAWAVTDWSAVTAADFASLFDPTAAEPVTLLIGTCRTFNVLMAEGRRVAATLLPVA